MSRSKAAVGLSLWVGFLAAAYLFLHSLAEKLPVPELSMVSAWMLNTSNPVLVLTAVRMVLMAIVIYLSFAVLLSVLAELTDLRWLRAVSRIAGGATPRLVRNALGISLAVAVASPTFSGSASATSVERPPVLHHVAPGERLGAPASPPTTAIPISVPVVETSSPELPATESWTALQGDNLWMISRRTLINRDQGHSNTDVADYLERLIDANRDQLEHGSPDLIFPGQVFILPKI